MKKRLTASPFARVPALTVLFLLVSCAPMHGQSGAPNGKTRLAVIGLDHDHVWGLLKDLAAEPNAELVAIADNHPELADRGKVMVNYWNASVVPTHELYHRVRDGQVGPIQRIIVRYGHQGPKEIGVSKYFADWLYDPVKNGGGAIMDFGCYGAEWAVWLKGRPARVSAVTQKLKVEQHNPVDDDATIVLDYPDGTAIIEASWDWPYNMGQVQVFGPKGSLLATARDLFSRQTGRQEVSAALEGERVALDAPAHETSNPISYFVDCIRNNKPIEDPLSMKVNVQVMEILDAARESVRTGKQQELR